MQIIHDLPTRYKAFFGGASLTNPFPSLNLMIAPHRRVQFLRSVLAFLRISSVLRLAYLQLLRWLVRGKLQIRLGANEMTGNEAFHIGIRSPLFDDTPCGEGCDAFRLDVSTAAKGNLLSITSELASCECP